MPIFSRSVYRTTLVVSAFAGVAASATLLNSGISQQAHTHSVTADAAAPRAFDLSVLAVRSDISSDPSAETAFIGMNLGNPSYWSTEWMFNDLIQSTGQLFYVVGARGVPFTNQTKQDGHGRPQDVAAGTRFDMAIQNHNGPRLSGNYSCHIAPGWVVKATGNDVRINQRGNNFTMSVPKARYDPRVVLELTAKVSHVSLSNLSCKANGFSGLFNPAFLADTRPFRIVRFMNWMRTNNAPRRLWTERPTANALSQAGEKGVALEHMVALCTELSCDPWFTLPMDTDADYYRQFAIYVRDHLPRDRKVYVELSNEVWNTAFEQGKQATLRGLALYSGVSKSQANDFYYADRVRAMMAIWSEVFAGQQNRLVRVYASQAANARRAEQGLSHNETWRSVDALAVAPYIFGFIQEFPGSGSERVDAVFAKAPALLDQAIGWAVANKAVATRYKLGFMTYEGGQHFFGYTPDAKADLNAMQRDSRMCTLYRTYLDRWTTDVGGQMVLFDSVGSGPFSHKDYTGQPVAEAPKIRAILKLPCVTKPVD